MLSLGGVVGLLVGLSNSPVVAVLLPLLFALLGGTGGFFALRVDFSKDGPKRGLAAFGASLTCICVGIATGTFWGLALRETPRSWSLLATEACTEFPPGGVTDDEALEWVLLDARLCLLGLTLEQRALLLERISVSSPFPMDLHATFVELVSLIKTAMPSEEEVVRADEWLAIQEQVERLESATSGIEFSVLPRLVSQEIARLSENAGLLSDDDDDKAYLASNEEAADALQQFEARLLRLGVELFQSESSVRRVNDSLRLFLEASDGEVGLGGVSRVIASSGVVEPGA